MNKLLKGISIYLIGMMGSGKTTVGKVMAQKLGYRFFDTDVLIEQVAAKSINEIFATVGEASFRELESKVLAELSAYLKSAIATGGGIVLRPENWSYLHHGLIVWLDAPLEVLIKRLAADNTRPLLQVTNYEEKLKLLLEQRRHLYAQADLQIKIEDGQTPAAIVAELFEMIPTVLKPDFFPRNDLN
ncbi:MAG: shikimate kinase [Gomphosphaeria aponina SAG 52.96 = DSM 107014]|uniref:Shikimate kinase n=1 Tax=Gomphosphaeria aponina SAG 52.96 = DSM 107014 TaxID=1521640 RepID=A0A941GRG6_9CHRO|nr:shikimate kinase [Gomphosphaeria aponina SAG 52.96 = DSM 107014]